MNADNIITLDFKLPKLPRASKRVAAVKQLEASAKVHGITLVRKPTKLEDKWIEWHRSIVNG